MESYSDKNKSIRAFNLRSRTSEFLPELLPLLEADYGWEHLRRVSDTREQLQLYWQNGEECNEKYATLCITLSKSALSLTVAMDYQIDSQQKSLARSTLVIHESSYTALHSIHRHNMVQLSHLEADEAIDTFKTEFNNTLIGLGYRDAQPQETFDDSHRNRFNNFYEQETLKLAS